jgi:hypothetical protein
MGVNCWPTVMIFGPDNRPLFQATGEGKERDLETMLIACINKYLEMERDGTNNDWVLDTSELPIVTEKQKHFNIKEKYTKPEQITALR